MAASDDLPRLSSEDASFKFPFTTCFSCKEMFDDIDHAPRVLAGCGHTICECCLISASTSADGVEVVCPACGMQTRLEVDEQCTKNYVLLEFLKNTPSEKQAARQCEYCEEQAAECSCRECGIQYCSRCWTTVHRRGLATHEKLTLSFTQQAFCPKHPGKSLDLVCADSKCSEAGELLCVFCEKTGHRNHNTALIEEIAGDRRKQMQAVITQLRANVVAGTKTFAAASAFLAKAYTALTAATNALQTTNDREFLSAYRTQQDSLCALSGIELPHFWVVPLQKTEESVSNLSAKASEMLASTCETASKSVPCTEIDDDSDEQLRQHVENTRERMQACQHKMRRRFSPVVLDAAAKGDVHLLRQALASHAHLIDTPDPDANNGWTPMHVAVSEGHLKFVETLVRLGSKATNTPERNGWTPMDVALLVGQIDVIETLARFGSKTTDNRAHLYSAALKGHVSVVEFLVRLGSKAIDTPNNGCALMFAAASNGHVSVIELLVRLGSKAIDTPNNDGRTPMYAAAENGHASVIEALVRLGSKAIDIPNCNGWTPMYAAASNGHVSAIETLIRLGSNAIDTPDNNGDTPMYAAAQNGHVSAIELLIRLGSKAIDTPHNNGRYYTPMHAAVEKGHVSAIETLIRLGSKAHKGAFYGSPQHIAQNDQIRELLKKHGANMNFQ